MASPATDIAPLSHLALVWLALLLLSGLSMVLGEWAGQVYWLPAAVSTIIWVKAWLIAHYFLETHQCVAFIRRLVLGFIAFAPIALILTNTFGTQIASVLKL